MKRLRGAFSLNAAGFANPHNGAPVRNHDSLSDLIAANMTEEIKRIAQEIFWWQPPEISLANPRRFLAQVMTLGTWQETQLVKDEFGWDALRDALLNAPPGIFDGRSWAYWRSVFRLPEAELPRRSLR